MKKQQQFNAMVVRVLEDKVDSNAEWQPLGVHLNTV
jgi:hypothetical protein